MTKVGVRVRVRMKIMIGNLGGRGVGTCNIGPEFGIVIAPNDSISSFANYIKLFEIAHGFSLAIGPVLDDVLIDWLHWRWCFLMQNFRYRFKGGK